MRSYKQITFWENDERIKYLKNFNSHVVNYFNNIGHSNVGGSWEEEIAKKERREINKLIDKAHSYIIATGVSARVINYLAPKTGRGLDLVLNIFNLGKMHIGHRPLLDFIERAMAIYENDKKNAVLRTWNPIFWIILFVDLIISLPFEFLGKFGLQQDKLEASFGGRLFKFLFSLIIYGEAFLNILKMTGYLPKLLIVIEKIISK
jgi:hypothetical protein